MRHGSFTREFNCTAIRQIVQQSLSHYQSHGGINSKRLEGRKGEGGPGSIGVSVRARGVHGERARYSSATTAEQLINTLFCTYKLSSLINNMDYDWTMI